MKNRSPIKVFILSVVTLGIYDIYWLVKTKEALNKETSKHIPTVWLLLLPVLVSIVAIILIVFFMVIAQNSTSSVNNGSFSYGVNGTYTGSSSSGVATSVLILPLLVLLMFVTIIPYWFFKFSKAVNEYTRGHMSTAVSFLLIWVLHFIGVALIQDAINDTLEGGGQTIPTSPGSGPVSIEQEPVTPQAPTSVSSNIDMPMQSHQAVVDSATDSSQVNPNTLSPTSLNQPELTQETQPEQDNATSNDTDGAHQ